MAATLLEDSGARVDTTYGPTITHSSFTFSLTTAGTNRFVSLYYNGMNSANISSISGGGTWTMRKQDTNKYGELWTCPCATQQTAVTVTVTLSAAAATDQFAVNAYYLASGVIPAYDNSNSAVVSVSTPSVSLTTVSGNTTAVAYISSTGSITAGTGYTATGTIVNGTTSNGCGSEISTSDTPTAGTSVSAGFTLGSGSRYIVIMSLVYSGSSFIQEHYMFYNDDGTTINNSTALAGSLVTAAQDTAFYDIETSTKLHIRIEVANTGTVAGNITRRLEFSEDGGAWTQITTGTNNVRLASSTTFADGDATTSRLTAVGSFQAGKGKQSGSDTTSLSLTNGNYTEDEWSVIFQSTASGHAYQFRVTNAGVIIQGYLVTPTIAPISWANFGGFNTPNYSWQNRKSHVNIKTSNANFPGYFRLLDVTAGNVAVTNSKVGTTNTSTAEVTGSSTFSLTSGHQYRGQLGIAHGGTASLLRVSSTP